LNIFLKQSSNLFIVLDKVLENSSTELPINPDTAHRCCTIKVLNKRLPILQWLPKYTLNDHGIPDLVAGITVGLTVIPQAIAFANVAGLPPQVSSQASHLRILFTINCLIITA